MKGDTMRKGIYDLETLRKAYNRGDHLKYLFFWGHTPPADGRINESCFSQWWIYVCGAVYDGGKGQDVWRRGDALHDS